MGANTTKQVAWLTGAAKDDSVNLAVGTAGVLTKTFALSSLLANDPGSASFYGVYATATPYKDASTKTPLGAATSSHTALGGTIALTKSTGTFTYTPPASITAAVLQALPAGATITDSFYYVIWMADKGAYSLAHATVVLTGIDDAATITGGVTGSVVEDVTILATGTLSIVDPDTGEAGFASTSMSGSYGTLTRTDVSTGSGTTAGSATWSYGLDHDLANALKEGETQTETFVVHSKGGAPVTITITVTGTNDGPTAVADAASTGENTSVTIDAVANDTDPDHDHVLSLVSVDAVTGGGSASMAGGKVVFDPGSDFNHLAQGASATVTIDYTMTDEHGATSSSTITVTVDGENDGPTANADTASTDEDTSVTIDVLANDTDPDDGAVLTASVDGVSGGGSASIDEDGKVVFDPGSDFNHLAQGASATVTINYTTTDEFGATSSSSVTVTVAGVNDGPTANDDSAVTDQNTAIAIDAVGNDTDPDDGAVLSVVSVGDPDGGGSVSIDEDGNISFDPGSDFVHLAAGDSATVTFDYTMSDEHGAQSTASITVEVDGVNDNAEMGGVYTGSVTEDGTLVATGTLTVDDVDDGEDGFAAVDDSALHGTYGDFTFDGDTGAWKYTLNNAAANVQALNTGDHPTDTLTVSSYDGTASETITVTINGMNEPIVVDLTATYQVNHGRNESDHQTLNGFHAGDILKMDGPISYVGFTTSGGNTVVTFLDNAGNGGGEQFDLTLVGFTGFNPNEVI